jgi:uncharacterized damage-inducible protein DinB
MSAYPAALYFAAQARNNAWANHRLLNACEKLSQEEFEATRTSFFPSIKATLNHILIVGWFYVDAMEGGTLGPAAFANPLPCATLAELRREQAAVDNRLIAWCETLDDLGGIVEIHRGARIQRERADRLLLHLFEHDIHHRGQVHAMLSGTSVKPPQLDEFFSVGEAPLRADDFAELGWTERDIWPDQA